MIPRKSHHKGFRKHDYQTALAKRKGQRRYGLKRGKRLAPRIPNKAKTVAGDSARAIKDECDQLVREIIGLRDQKCFTCPRTENLHVGHLFRRGIEALRWNLSNCNAQCDPCNERHEYDREPYVFWFKLIYGEYLYITFCRTSDNSHKFTYIELLEIRDELRRELAAIEAAQKEKRAA